MSLFLCLLFLCGDFAVGLLVQDAGNQTQLGTLQPNTDMTMPYPRHQLENIIYSMGNKIDQMEKAMAQKETEFENKLTATNYKISKLEQYHSDVSRELEKERNTRENLEQLNQVLEDRLENITKEFEAIKNDIAETNVKFKNFSNFADLRFSKISKCCMSGKNDSVQFTQEIAEIRNRVENLTNEHSDVSTELEKERNNTENLDQLNQILEEKLENITNDFEATKNDVAEISVKLANFTYFADLRFSKLSNCCMTGQNDLVQFTQEIAEIRNRVENLTNDSDLKMSPKEMDTNMTNMTMTSPAIAFSVIVARQVDNGILKFGQILSNSGGGYNQSTGKFTCEIPGHYFFSATLIKDDVVSECTCYMYVSGTRAIRVFANAGLSSSSFSSASSSIVYKLSKGDTVYLGGCNAIGSFYTADTTFSGFLISPLTH